MARVWGCDGAVHEDEKRRLEELPRQSTSVEVLPRRKPAPLSPRQVPILHLRVQASTKRRLHAYHFSRDGLIYGLLNVTVCVPSFKKEIPAKYLNETKS